MVSLIVLLVFPFLWPIAAKLIWKHEITMWEMALNLVVGVALSSGGWALGHYAQLHDTEVRNGQLVSKESKQVTCEHTYSCNCRQSCSGSGSKRSCHTTCDTCRRHSSDFDWLLHGDVGDVKVSRVNSRGDQEPARYTAAAVGDPFAVTASYLNYIKAAPDSLFNHLVVQSLLAEYEKDIPAYPVSLKDYHYLDRVLPVKTSVPDLNVWNSLLATELKTLGPKKQVNVVVVWSGHNNANFAEALNASWLGGKKNDVIVVLGTPKYPEISWVRVFSWTDKEVFKVKLRDSLLDLKQADPSQVIALVSKHVSDGYVRKPMADFEYLQYEVELSWQMWLTLIAFSVFVSVGTSWLLARNSVRTYGRVSF